ncbi:MAG: hypothetical protein R3Y63_12445 [Eubacteriales bacterium]
MDEREKLLQRKKEDLRFIQSCVFVVLALMVEVYLFQVRDYFFGLNGTWERAFLLQDIYEWGLWIGIILFFSGVIWTGVSIYTGKGDIFYPISTFAVGFVLYATCWGITLYGEKGVNILLFLVPAWAGLGLIFCLYQVEFFISAFFTSLGGVCLWLSGQTELFSGGSLSRQQLTFYVCLNATILIIIFGFYMVNKAFHNEGVLRFYKQDLTLISDLKDNSSLWLVGLSGVLSLVTLAVAITLGFQVIYYCTILLLGWLFVLLVYYTVKLM